MEENKIKIKKKKKQKNLKIKNLILNILFLICLGVFIYSAGNIALEYYGSYKAKNNLASLKNTVIKTENKSSEKNTEVERIIDLDKLKELNSDSLAWIEIPGTDLDEPLVQTNNNDYYLWYSFEKKRYPLTGTIFLDYQNKPDFSDRVNYIFGHNMWDKTKFSCLVLFEDPEFAKKHDTVKIHLKDKVLEYEILGVNLVPPETPLYPENLNKDSEFNTFKNELKKYISKEKVDKIDKDSKLLLMVTCKTPDNTTERRIMFAKLK